MKNRHLFITIFAVFLFPLASFCFVSLTPEYLDNGIACFPSNRDDDNNNGIMDYHEGSQVVGENDLLQVEVSYGALAQGTLNFSFYDLYNNVVADVKMWRSSDKSGGEVKKTWNLMTETPPRYVYIETIYYYGEFKMSLSYMGYSGYYTDNFSILAGLVVMIRPSGGDKTNFVIPNSNTNPYAGLVELWGTTNLMSANGTMTMTFPPTVRVWANSSKSTQLPNTLITNFTQGELREFRVFLEGIKTSKSYQDSIIELKFETDGRVISYEKAYVTVVGNDNILLPYDVNCASDDGGNGDDGRPDRTRFKHGDA